MASRKRTLPGDLLGAVDGTLEGVLAKLAKGRIVLVGCSNQRDVAGRYWQDNHGRRPLRFYQGQPYRYVRDEGRYRAQDLDAFKTEALTFVEQLYEKQSTAFRECFERQYGEQLRPRPIRGAFVDDVVESLKAMTIVPAEAELPVWLGTERQGRLLSMANGCIDLDALIRSGMTTVESHSPLFFTLTCLPFAYVPDAQCPRWESFLAEVLEGDPQRIRLLQEWIGYCLIPSTQFQKFLLLEP